MLDPCTEVGLRDLGLEEVEEGIWPPRDLRRVLPGRRRRTGVDKGIGGGGW